MKTANFFNDKAESFSSQLNEIIPLEFTYSFTNDIYKDRIDGDNTKYYAQEELLNEIKFQMKLMFSEFDNGKLFLERIENFNVKNVLKRNEEELENLKEVNRLFLEFLKEYRN